MNPRSIGFIGGGRVAKILLADAQTSGGLLISVPADRSRTLVEELHRRNVAGARAGLEL